MIDKISRGPITVIITGSQTNLAIFLMKNPHLKRNIEHIYIMGGSVRSKNGDPGNLFSDSTSNPYAEFNIFADPFASYQVMQFLRHASNQSLCLSIIYDYLDRLT